MRDRVRATVRWLSGVALLGLLITGCSSGADTTESEFSVLGSLAQIPANAEAGADGHWQISMADMDAVASIAGVSRPEQIDDVDQVLAYLLPITGDRRSELVGDERILTTEQDRVHVAFPGFLIDGMRYPAEFVDEFGFNVFEMTSFVRAIGPDTWFLVSNGVSLRTDLPQLMPGIFTVGEGEDRVQDFQSGSIVRPGRRPYRMAMRDDQIAISLDTAPIQAWHDQTTAKTLADDPFLSRVANILDEYGVVSAHINGWKGGVRMAAYGWGEGDEGPLGVVVMSFDSAADATAHLPGFTEAFSYRMTPDSIEQRGSDLVAAGRHNGALYLLTMGRRFPFCNSTVFENENC